MKIKPLVLMLYVVCWVLHCGPAFSGCPKNITVGIVEWPPYIDKDHIALGLVPEIVQLSFMDRDVTVTFSFYDNWDDCIQALEKGVIHASAPYTPTDARKNNFLFSDEAIVELTATVFYMRQNPIKIPKADLFLDQDAFAKFKIGGVDGYYYKDMLTELHIVYTSKTQVNFQKLFMGKVDLVVENELIGWNTLSQLFPYSMFRFAELHESRDTKEGCLIVKNDAAGKTLVDCFDQGLARLKENELYEDIIEKYKRSFKRLFD